MTEQYRKHMESNEFTGTSKQRKRKFKAIIKDLGSREITLENIANDEKQIGIMQVMKDQHASLDEWMMLKSYAEAITNGDVRHMTFLRDTAGQKPSTEIITTESPLSNLTTEDLLEAIEELRSLTEEGE